MSMEHFVKTLAGVKMPRIIYGTAWKKEKTTELVVKAILAGFRGIDTACQPRHYREDLVGAALQILAKEHKISREELFLQTKFTSPDGQDPESTPYDPKASLPDQVRQSFSRSLQNLHTEYLDSIVLHSPMRTHKETMIVWKVFEEFYQSGKVKQLGISNIYDVKELMSIWEEATIKPSVIQNRFYRQTGYDSKIRAFCNKTGIIYQSFWSLTANPHLLQRGPIFEYAKKNKVLPEQVFYKFLMQIGIAPLNGTTNEVHMKKDLEVLDWSPLPDDVVRQTLDLLE